MPSLFPKNASDALSNQKKFMLLDDE